MILLPDIKLVEQKIANWQLHIQFSLINLVSQVM